jgi:hypothetical protein
MKRYTTIILTLALVACSKSSVTYDEPGTIAIQPVSEGMTKAAVGATPTGQELLIWANYTDKGTNTNAGDTYLNRAVFAKDATGLWTGKEQEYFWPKSGTVALSGCTSIPDANGSISYNYSENKIKVEGYKQSLNTAETVDFIWFNQTAPTNLDRTNENLAVVMNHALTWVTIQVKGFGGSEGWKVESITLQGIKDTGDLTCTTAGPVWDVDQSGANNIIVFQAPTTGSSTEYFTLTGEAQNIENHQKGTVLIPQTPVQMEVKYHTTGSPSDGSYGNSPSTLRSKTLDLKISETPADNFWQAGKHYVYTVTFNPYKITFSVSDSSWEEDVDTNVNNYVDSEIKP